MWYNAFELVEEANLKCSTEATVDFYLIGHANSKLKLEKCGIYLMYGQDAMIIKVGETKSRKRKYFWHEIYSDSCIRSQGEIHIVEILLIANGEHIVHVVEVKWR